jgi:hypothetical protein
MRKHIVGPALVLCLLAAACGGSHPSVKVKAGPRRTPDDVGRRGEGGPAGVRYFGPVIGDYAATGVMRADLRTDLPKLMDALKAIGARDYFHLVWGKPVQVEGWEDFKRLAPECRAAGIRLWLYLVPPSEPPSPEPFGADYPRWAAECATLAKEYPNIAGICIDDFNGNTDFFTPAYCLKMMARARETAPNLALLAVNYFGYYGSMAEHVRRGAIDGVVFPYFYPHRNHSDTEALLPQIETFRRWLDDQSARGEIERRIPLVVMIYAAKHSQSSDVPSPAYVRRGLEIGLEATGRGWADGVVTYCLPKDRPEFLSAVAAVYKKIK